ncbi:MAG TPA: transporter substrate-binding domain-containing protein, partial [Thiotrichales bacterium]|nr:transporter substrate-binding domain-containing protein [Thiotrichales bacterium]
MHDRQRSVSPGWPVTGRYRCLLIVILMLGALALAGCEKPAASPPVTLAAPHSILPALIWLTADLGYFDEQGLNLKLQTYPSGKRALAALMRGEAELAATAETPFVIASFKRDDLRLYATLGQSDNEVSILARRDHGITAPPDLRGKTVATQEGSAIHFFLTSFLLFHRISETDINIRFMKVEDLAPALVNGDIDAVSIREPYRTRIRKQLGDDRLVDFHARGLYTKTYNLVG